jgi:hypothetical protein
MEAPVTIIHVAHRRIYVEESLRINDAFTEQLEDDVADMQKIMGLGAREAADIRSEIVSKTYKYAVFISATTQLSVQSFARSSCICLEHLAVRTSWTPSALWCASLWCSCSVQWLASKGDQWGTRSEMFRKNLQCRRLLREQFRNGRLDAATSKAEVLEELCDKLNFDPDAAAALHKQLYREKLLSVVADKKISGEPPGSTHACVFQ